MATKPNSEPVTRDSLKVIYTDGGEAAVEMKTRTGTHIYLVTAGEPMGDLRLVMWQKDMGNGQFARPSTVVVRAGEVKACNCGDAFYRHKDCKHMRATIALTCRKVLAEGK